MLARGFDSLALPMTVRARKLPAWVRRRVLSFHVRSCADGSLRVEPEWSDEPGELGSTPAGVLTRSALAAAVQEALDRCLGIEP